MAVQLDLELRALSVSGDWCETRLSHEGLDLFVRTVSAIQVPYFMSETRSSWIRG